MSTFRIEYVEVAVWRVDIEADDREQAVANFWDRLGDLSEASEIGIDHTDINSVKEVK